MQLDQFISLDTETTDWDKTNPHFFPTQVAGVWVDSGFHESFAEYVHPGETGLAHMSPDVVGLTGLGWDFLAENGKDPVEVAGLVFDIIANFDGVIAQNWEFDKHVFKILAEPLGQEAVDYLDDVPFIDTLRVAKELYDVGTWTGHEDSAIPNHKLGTLFHAIVPERKWVQLPSGVAHDARFDATMTIMLVEEWMEQGHGLNWMVDISKAPFVPRVCPIGDQKGKPWDEVNQGFLEWMVKKKVWGDDEGLEEAVLVEMDRRGML